ncbi:esterase/lipase family protein [Streptomyces diastatochromogenes]|uniref:esterase/lipase family protein n=1 Tax=Streptomyces diastatochromogenes TaxID=42236 RepID=UPI0036890BD1
MESGGYHAMRRESVEDLVVVVPGIMGSRLGLGGREVWGPSPGAVWQAVRTFAGSVRELALPKDIGDDHPGDGVVPLGLVRSLHALPGVWPLTDGYDTLLDWLRGGFTLRPAANLVEFAYDWRLSCRHNARLLARRIDEALGRWQASAPGRADARVRLICHSMGGLVGRYYVECLGGAEVTRRLITLGTPHRGSIGALDSLVSGHRLGRRGPRVGLLTGFARSLPSLHQLVPDYACLDGPRGLLKPPEVAGGLPGVDPELLEDAAKFHEDIRDAALARVRRGGSDRLCLPVVGVRQPTPTTAALEGERLRLRDTIEGTDEGGDGRVPRFAAFPVEVALDIETARQAFATHGALKTHAGVREGLFGLLAPAPRVYRGADPAYPLSVRIPEQLPAGEPLPVAVQAVEDRSGADALAVRAELTGPDGIPHRRTLRNLGGGRYAGQFAGLGPGAYRVSVHAAGDTASGTVTALALIGDDEDDVCDR